MTVTASMVTLAARLGLSEKTVRRAAALDHIEAVPGTRGKFPVEAVEAACRKHCNADMLRGHALAGRGDLTAAQVAALGPVDPLEGLYPADVAPEPVPVGPAAPDAPSASFGTLASLKRDGERLKVEKQQLDLDERRGRLVSRESVERVASDIVRRATFHFLALAERATPRVMGKKDPAEVAAILEEEARRSLAELSSLDRLADEVLGLA